MKYILDTDVISAVQRPELAPKIPAWLASKRKRDLFLSVITFGEVERGIHLQGKPNPEFAENLRAWLNPTVSLFGDRLLPVTAQDARIWGELSARIGQTGADLMIPAQALARDATVVTGNASAFIPTGVRFEDPF